MKIVVETDTKRTFTGKKVFRATLRMRPQKDVPARHPTLEDRRILALIPNGARNMSYRTDSLKIIRRWIDLARNLMEGVYQEAYRDADHLIAEWDRQEEHTIPMSSKKDA